MAVFQPVGPSFNVTAAATANVGTALTQQTKYLRVVASGASFAHVAVCGFTSAATSADTIIAEGVPEIISINQPTSQTPVGVASTGSTTEWKLAEGTGSQFVTGQKVLINNLPSEPWWGTLGVGTVISVNQRANFPNGDYPYNVTVTTSHNSAGVVTDIGTGTRLTSAFQVTAIRGGLGSGVVHCQQVQITGG